MNVICKKRSPEHKHFNDDDIMKYCLFERIKWFRSYLKKKKKIYIYLPTLTGYRRTWIAAGFLWQAHHCLQSAHFNGNLTQPPSSVAKQAFFTGSKVHKSSIWYIHISGLNRGTHLQFGKEQHCSFEKASAGRPFRLLPMELKARIRKTDLY